MKPDPRAHNDPERREAENAVKISLKLARALNHDEPEKLEWLNSIERALSISTKLGDGARTDALEYLIPVVEVKFPWLVPDFTRLASTYNGRDVE
ncbi:hypothetical protein [Cypionkella sp.]|uniref:hypothetical protein n=1 Tax=Cypionkella sp. TaxID=2811411 RepID=UPI00262B6BAE|nr:hypothetical protein [Cypionkella sp.]